MKHGFTLIEVIIYISLFTMLMGTALITAYQLIEGSSKLGPKANVLEEGNFVIQKLNWVLKNVESITTPDHETSNTLIINKYDGNVVSIRLNNGKIEMKESIEENTFTPITTANVSVSDLRFTYMPASGGTPPGLDIMTKINNQTFTITKYLRQ